MIKLIKLSKKEKTLSLPFVKGGTSEIFAFLLDKLLKWLIDSHYLISLVITELFQHYFTVTVNQKQPNVTPTIISDRIVLTSVTIPQVAF